jgi:dTDP-4-dehydrorhamnose 3,5-epimerase
MSGAQNAISGVVHSRLNPIADERGAFMEVWRASTTDNAGVSFRQANLSRSMARVLRGMHFHERQVDLWILLHGRASVALVDLRQAIRGGEGIPSIERFEMTAGDAVLIPERVAHGFLAVEPIELLYLVSNEYDGTDEYGFAWSDPDIALDWIARDPIVSGRDARNPPFAEAVAVARQRDAATPR